MDFKDPRPMNSDEDRAQRRINPFTGKQMEKVEVINRYTPEYHERLKKLFSERNTFLHITERLQLEFPHYEINSDKVKNYYIRFQEEMLLARDKEDGRFDAIKLAEEAALFHLVTTTSMESIEPLVDRRKDMESALEIIDPVQNPKAYSTLISGIARATKLIEDLSGVTASRSLKVMRNQMLLAMDMKVEMIKRGLVPRIERPNTVQLDIEAEKGSDWRPTVINTDGSIEAEVKKV